MQFVPAQKVDKDVSYWENYFRKMAKSQSGFGLDTDINGRPLYYRPYEGRDPSTGAIITTKAKAAAFKKFNTESYKPQQKVQPAKTKTAKPKKKVGRPKGKASQKKSKPIKRRKRVKKEEEAENLEENIDTLEKEINPNIGERKESGISTLQEE